MGAKAQSKEAVTVSQKLIVNPALSGISNETLMMLTETVSSPTIKGFIQQCRWKRYK